MPWANDPAIQSLRLKYNAAVAAHKDCSRALMEASMRGDLPTASLVDAETKARTTMNDVRAQLLAAMTQAITGGLDPGALLLPPEGPDDVSSSGAPGEGESERAGRG
jgi:hypothetical protein